MSESYDFGAFPLTLDDLYPAFEPPLLAQSLSNTYPTLFPQPQDHDNHQSNPSRDFVDFTNSGQQDPAASVRVFFVLF